MEREVPSEAEIADIKRGIARLRHIRYRDPAAAIERLLASVIGEEAAIAHQDASHDR